MTIINGCPYHYRCGTLKKPHCSMPWMPSRGQYLPPITGNGDVSKWVKNSFAYLVFFYCFFLISWPNQYFYFWFKLLRHLFYWFNKWQYHLTRFVESVTKTKLRKATIDLIIASNLKLLYMKFFCGTINPKQTKTNKNVLHCNFWLFFTVYP